MLIVTGLLAATVLMAPSTAADEARARKTTEEIFALMHMDRANEEVLEKVADMIAGQIESEEMPHEATEQFMKGWKRFMNEIMEEMSFERNKADYIDLYVKTFTPAELDGLLAFYRSPAG